ncbi:MAG TPA: Druantia anti-phage system protein DruA [Bryobacteraceae bacterium]|nr:Druantia anti-phage system protein DruA [Bryobacteraceae bacterium]
MAQREFLTNHIDVLAFCADFWHTAAVAEEYRYRGRNIGRSEILFVRQFIAEHPEMSRYALSRQLCELWQWKQANGALRDMVCRGLLLLLHRAGEIHLPPTRCGLSRDWAEYERPEPIVPDNRPVRGPLDGLLPLEFQQVRRTEQEPLFDSLIEQYHYLRYQQPVGEHLKYLVSAKGQVIACLAWSSAVRHLASRDRFIGWSAEVRKRNLHLLAYNSRFLILPWVQVPHLASHILGRMAKLVARDWQAMYAHPIYWLETFVDPARFQGTCYRAANWRVLGHTTGRGKNAPSKKPRFPVKEVLALPLTARFRELLAHL